MYYLQNRWKLDGKLLRYYGLRNKENMFNNAVKLTKKQLNIIKNLPCNLTDLQLKAVKSLAENQIITEQPATAPNSLDTARFCVRCAANDYIIPGLEFDRQGLCPLCQTKAETAKLKSITPIKNTFPRSVKSRFDVALFYTGGKDSTYLLYYLAKVCSLRVLALTWEIPFMSNSARASIENAKTRLPTVEFVSRKIADDDLRKIYRKLYLLADNTCACPSLAYILFYPDLVDAKVPYFVAGNESAQIVGLYYNRMAPKIAYGFWQNKFFNGLINFGRVLTLRPPYKSGQLHTIATMKQLAYGDSVLKKASGYTNELISNVVTAIREVPQILNPLKKAIRRSNFTGNIPRFVQIDMDEISGGKYDWRKIKDIITEECGWVAPNETSKGLHTSCKIEKCKEQSQFKRFYNMQSTMIPFSALEIALASRDDNITREQAIEEMKTALGFTLDDIEECDLIRRYLR